MRPLSFCYLLILVAVSTSTSQAQVKVSGGGICRKPNPAYSIQASDNPSHIFSLSQYDCTWTKPFVIAGTKTKGGPDIISVEVQGNRGSWREFYVDTTDTGDKGYYRLHGTATFRNGQLQAIQGKWTLNSGTGKLKGVKGAGTCSGKGEANGELTYECTGEYYPTK